MIEWNDLPLEVKALYIQDEQGGLIAYKEYYSHCCTYRSFDSWYHNEMKPEINRLIEKEVEKMWNNLGNDLQRHIIYYYKVDINSKLRPLLKIKSDLDKSLEKLNET
jgi:hypothetical protein